MLEKFLRSIRRRRRYICVKATIQLGHYFFVLRSCPSTRCIIYWKVHSQTTCNVLGYLILLTEWAQMENHIDCNITTSGCQRISCCKIAHILLSWKSTRNKQTIIISHLFKDLIDKYISSLHCGMAIINFFLSYWKSPFSSGQRQRWSQTIINTLLIQTKF